MYGSRPVLFLRTRETGEHVLCGHGFLAHARRYGQYSHNHAALIAQQIVVLMVQPVPPLGGVAGIQIRGLDT